MITTVKTLMTRGVWGVVGAIALCACSGSVIDVGPGAGGAPERNEQGGATSSKPNGTCTDPTPLPEWPSTSACAGSNDSPLIGKWHGYVENGIAPWDELFLDIKGANSSELCGTLTVGSAAPPPPATDPVHGYPLDQPDLWNWGAVIPGYASTLLDAKIDGTRVRFWISAAEAYKSWCELQTPFERSQWTVPKHDCGCAPGFDVEHDDDANRCTITDSSGIAWTMTCDQAVMCNSLGYAQLVCVCNAAGCGSAQDSGDKFDLILTGDTLEGTETRGELTHTDGRTRFTRSR